MPVNISRLEGAIRAAFDAEKERIDDQQGSINRISRALAVAASVEIVEGINTAIITLSNSAGPVTGTITASAE